MASLFSEDLLSIPKFVYLGGSMKKCDENAALVRRFRISSACGGGNCVEVSMGETVLIRDSKHSTSGVLEFSRDEWQEFVWGVKAGEFDL